jgi:site-specific DNA-cytosine methylase
MTDKLKIISLCDGMSCGALALEPWLDQQGLTWDDIEYHAFEIDKYADAVSRYNYPMMYRHGDARNYKKFIGDDIFLLMGGFPCQPYSFSGKGGATDDERDLSNLIFEALRELKPKYFLFENVPMKEEHQDRISEGIGVEPIVINSQDFSAHHRKRLYWTNIKIDQWVDKGIVLNDILEDGFSDRDKSYCVDANYFKGGSMKMYYEKARRQLVFDTVHKRGCRQVGIADIKGYDIIKRVYDPEYKAPALTTMQGGWRQPKVAVGSIINRKINPETGKRDDYNPDIQAKPRIELRADQKSGSLTTVQKDNIVVDQEEMFWRNLTPLECERLQTVPDGYTEMGIFANDKDYDPVLHEHCQRKTISNSQRYKMLGNGWTVDVISHLMKNMEVGEE